MIERYINKYSYQELAFPNNKMAYTLNKYDEKTLTNQSKLEDRPKITILRRALKNYCKRKVKI